MNRAASIRSLAASSKRRAAWDKPRGRFGEARGFARARRRSAVDHTPTVPADERAARLLERAPEPQRTALLAAIAWAQEEAAKEGDELQAEFGKDHVALIVGCNQFVRLWRGGAQPGALELLLDPAAKASLGAVFPLGEPEGAVFKLFGWVRLDPSTGPGESLRDAVTAAFRKAKATKAPKR